MCVDGASGGGAAIGNTFRPIIPVAFTGRTTVQVGGLRYMLAQLTMYATRSHILQGWFCQFVVALHNAKICLLFRVRLYWREAPAESQTDTKRSYSPAYFSLSLLLTPCSVSSRDTYIFYYLYLFPT